MRKFKPNPMNENRRELLENVKTIAERVLRGGFEDGNRGVRCAERLQWSSRLRSMLRL